MSEVEDLERWENDVVLSDGGTVHVRPIRPDDGPRILDFHGRQSPESIYFRYFTPRPKLSDADVEHLTHVDYVDRMAFVALRDDQLIGVARYDRWPTRSEAEVAFFVDDQHRGRGLATLLLEYLAVAARQTGISGFTASVLPTNQRMVGVFRQAGFQTASAFEDGVIEVRLDLQPTPAAEAAIEARAQRAEAEAVRLLLAPRSVAVVGASRDRHSVGHAVLRNLLLHEFAGPVYPVNPHATEIEGLRAVPSVDAVAGPVDLAVVCVPASGVLAAVAAVAGLLEAGAAVPASSPVPPVPSGGLVQYGYALRLPTGWAHTGGLPERRRSLLTPLSAPDGSDLISVERTPLGYDADAEPARARAELHAEFRAAASVGQPLSAFDDDTRFGGRSVVSYREAGTGTEAAVDWYIVLDGDAQLSVGCRHTDAGTDAVRAACETVVGSVHRTT
jgi:type VII secretion-associated protein (TIGR03931 family)